MANKKRKRRIRPPLDERHMLAIEMLARKGVHDTMDEIASLCGVDRRTLYRWRQREDFIKNTIGYTEGLYPQYVDDIGVR